MKTLIIKIKVFLNRFNPIAFTKVLKSLEDRIYYLDNENNKYHNELIQLNDKIFKLDESLSRDIYDLNIDNRHYLGLCKRKDNDLNNDVKRCFEKINTLNTTMNKKFKSIGNIKERTLEKINIIEDDLQDKLYDFKHQHITPIEDVISNNDKTIFNEVATLKEHIKSVEKLVNELCELNKINERG